MILDDFSIIKFHKMTVECNILLAVFWTFTFYFIHLAHLLEFYPFLSKTRKPKVADKICRTTIKLPNFEIYN